MAVCYRHPGRETNVACSNCGRPICPDCMTPTSVGMRCPECSREKTRVVRRAYAGGDLPDQALTFGREGNDRRRRARTLGVGDHLHFGLPRCGGPFDHRHARVGSA